jgi:hypothetical protein
MFKRGLKKKPIKANPGTVKRARNAREIVPPGVSKSYAIFFIEWLQLNGTNKNVDNHHTTLRILLAIDLQLQLVTSS